MAVAVLLSASTASATATVQKWTAGWDDFSEPLNYTTSKVSWSVNTTTRKLSVTFTLRGATPSKLYQVGAHILLHHVSRDLWPVSGFHRRRCLRLEHEARCDQKPRGG